jgi:hypothetical protein
LGGGSGMSSVGGSVLRMGTVTGNKAPPGHGTILPMPFGAASPAGGAR